MKAISKAFGVSRSNLLEQRRRQKASETPHAVERAEAAAVDETAENGLLRARIRELVGERPSYGYRRVTALLNRERTERVNPKRIYTIMRRNKLLLERCTGDGRGPQARRCHRHPEARLAVVLGQLRDSVLEPRAGLRRLRTRLPRPALSAASTCAT